MEKITLASTAKMTDGRQIILHTHGVIYVNSISDYDPPEGMIAIPGEVYAAFIIELDGSVTPGNNSWVIDENGIASICYPQGEEPK